MDILYFCSPPLLDYSIEQIKDLKRHVNLHVLVCVSLHSPNHTIFKLNDASFLNGIYTFGEIKDKIENVTIFEQSFSGCQSVHFVFFPARFGVNILDINIALLKFLRKLNPHLLHFDDISGRMSIFALLLNSKKIVVNVHDPAAHSGEHSWYGNLIRKILYKKISAFCVFSNFSKKLFTDTHHTRVPLIVLKLVPYQSYMLLGNKKITGIDRLLNEKVLLFFGRVSEYKGIDELLMAFVRLKRKYRFIKLVIAGKGTYSYHMPEELKGDASVIIIERFIRNDEIKSLFNQADVLVCPYRDATQSGVLMTAAVFEVPAIVSNAGALPEYVQDYTNGYIYNLNDENGLENALEKFLTQNDFEKKHTIVNSEMPVEANTNLLLKLYAQLTELK